MSGAQGCDQQRFAQIISGYGIRVVASEPRGTRSPRPAMERRLRKRLCPAGISAPVQGDNCNTHPARCSEALSTAPGWMQLAMKGIQ